MLMKGVFHSKLDCTILDYNEVHGGCINNSFVCNTNRGKFFVKVNNEVKDSAKMFEAEALGLQALYNTNTIRVPVPKVWGALENGNGYIIMEYIYNNYLFEQEIQNATPASQKLLGQQLAQLHSITPKENTFGFSVDNTIGSTPQINTMDTDWIRFYREKRIKFQLDLAKSNYPNDKNLQDAGSQLLAESRFAHLFKDIEGHIKPSLLHGDLWSGNFGVDENSQPVIYDPAVYYGHSEAELGIMDMFGGFSSSFWDEYHKYIPKTPNFAARHKLYQLYHYLNHYNMFGGTYKGSCVSIIQNLLDFTKQ